MASDLSSGCTDDIDIFEEKEEGELSLEDVSSSEESHPNYRSGYRTAGRCTNCMAMQICPTWCEAARAARKNHKKQDAAHGKENRRHIKDQSSTIPKPMVATLQEKNDDLVPISSDSDMEIVGLPGNSKQLHVRTKSAKVRKKKKKKRSHSNLLRIDDSLSPTQVETYLVDVPVVKKVRTSRPHHRESSPPRYSVRSPSERSLPKSPSRRYRTTRPIKLRSPQRRSRSPRVNSVEKKSPRKLRSPRRSPAPRSPVRPTIFRDARDHSLPTTSQTHIDIYATKLLQKVRRLESVGGSSTNNQSKNKEHSSLKEKLSNMMKNQAEGSHDKPRIRKQNNTKVINNKTGNAGSVTVESDDEDDIEFLRRAALETKQKKLENKIEETKIKSETNNIEESNDNDCEANELRILALKSAIMKKHEKRVTRGVKSKKIARSSIRVESPFNESFLDDIHLSGEENENFKSSNINFSPILNDDSNHPEDMDIDTDVEREKEQDSMPYSPTDDLTRKIVMEVESIETNDINNEKEILSVIEREKNITSERNTSPENSDYAPGVDTPYSPSAPIETPNLCNFVSHNLVNNRIEEIAENLSSPKNSDCMNEKGKPYYLPGVDTPFSPIRTMNNRQFEKSHTPEQNITNIESPYSPTDTPILDPHLFPIFPNLPVVQSVIETTEIDEENASSLPEIAKVHEVEMIKNVVAANENEIEVVACEELKINLRSQEIEKCKSPSTSDGHFSIPIRENSFKPIDSPDKLPEVDLDGSPLVPVSKELESAEIVIPIEILPEIADDANDEPLYLQCLSDVIKDTNKIPTIVNKTLVPTHILKTNKQLQQPLPQKKIDNYTEPSFKSAEMRPVSVDETQIKLPTLFKPIKLCPISKKPQVMTTIAAAAFNVSFGEDSIKETKIDDEISNVDVSTLNQEPKTTTIFSPTFEKSQEVDDDSQLNKKTNSRIKKRRRLRDKRKSFAVDESTNSESNRESIDDRTKIGQTNLNNASKKKGKSVVNTSETSDRVLRASIKKSLLKSWENFKDNILKDDKNTQREVSNVKSEKANTSKLETSQNDGKKKKSSKRTRRGGKKFQKRLLNNSADARNKLSDQNVTNITDHTNEKSGEKEIIETNKNEGDKKKNQKKVDESEKKRRCSIDEDEEALRAQLLASLPKRPKIIETDVSTPPENSANIIDQPLDTTISMSIENLKNKTTSSTITSADTIIPVNSFALSTQSSIPSSATETKVKIIKTENTEVAKKIIGSKLNNAEVSSLTPRKRPNSVIARGPPKKMVKKALPVLASTKVVNNAKKYQNALVQKKLNLQRAAMNYSTQNGSRNITLNNLKNNECARPSSPKISAASKTQRLVINLGSDSDSESEFENQSNNSNSGNRQEETRKPLPIPTTDFEKSVEQFLKDQRKKLESVTVTKQSASLTTNTSKIVTNNASPVTGKLSGLYNTPLAVRRHLPMSQQEEYRRLKQQIAEREREKLRKTIETGSVTSQKSPCTSPGPSSPTSAIVAVQKTQTINKVSVIGNELTQSILAPSIEDKTTEKSIVQKKIELVKANDNRLAGNITKASKLIVPAIPNKQITKPLVASSKINSIIPNISSTASASKAPVKILPKQNSINPNPKITAITSTPKAQSSIFSKIHTNISSRASLPHAKNAVSPAENIGKFNAESLNNSTKISLESSTNVSMGDKYCRNLKAISVPSLPSMTITSASRSSLKPTEILTIQIPNDKIQTDRIALTATSRSESSSPPNCRNVGMLKILTKEQLNSRFVRVKVKQGETGRTVTVGKSALSHDNATRSASSSPIPRNFCEARSDQFEKKTCCDNSLIAYENTLMRRRVESMEDSMIDDSEASTIVLSRNEGNGRKDRTADFEASTIVLSRNEGNGRKDRTADFEASTIVVSRNEGNGRKDRTADFEASTIVLSRNEGNGRKDRTADFEASTIVLSRNEGNGRKDRTADFEASTLILSRNEGNGRKDRTADSEASTIVLSRNEGNGRKDRTADSEASTLILSRNEGNNRKDRTADFEASTIVLSRNEGNGRKDRTADSEASTFVVSRNEGNGRKDRTADFEASTLILSRNEGNGRKDRTADFEASTIVLSRNEGNGRKDRSADSEASTLILSRNEGNGRKDRTADSEASTLILSRNEGNGHKDRTADFEASTLVLSRNEGNSREDRTADSEASTLVLSRNEGNGRKDRTADSEASTLILSRNEGNGRKDRSADSEASTLILSRNEGNNRKDRTADFEASTIVLSRNEGKSRKDRTADFEASTFVLSRNDGNRRKDRTADFEASTIVLSRNDGNRRKDRTADFEASTLVLPRNDGNRRKDRTADFEASTLVLSRNEGNSREDRTADSEASTIVLSRNDGTNRKDRTADSEASTIVLSRNDGTNRKDRTADSEASAIVVNHENAHNDRTADSEVSTFALDHDISEGQDSPALARTEESEDGSLAINDESVKQIKRQNKIYEKNNLDVKNELEILTALPADQQRIILIESEENLVAKRNMVLDDLTELSGCLHQWEVEREIQTKLIGEVRRLREQLRTAEKHLHEQRRQMNYIRPKVTKAHETIHHGRRECYKLSRICHGLGTKLIGEEYKVPDTCAQLLTERLEEVADHTRQLSKKKISPIDSLNDSRDTNSPASSTGSDTISEISFVEKPSNSTTPLLSSCDKNNITTTNFLTNENDFDADRITEKNSPPPDKSTADFPCPNSISKITEITTNEKISEETTLSNSTKKYSQNKNNEDSNSSEINAQMLDKEETDNLNFDYAQMNKKKILTSSKHNANLNSNVMTTNLFSIDRYEDISMPSTSKSNLQCELFSSDDKSTFKLKIDPYKSVLTHFKTSRSVNPDGILCPYELMGTCSDGDCQFYHLDPNHCQ